ncbi:hypothetical protein G6035_05370 [Arthrobacter sp. SDTb3-6]|nr:hypothetical protein [Arthrobacter sp. SDTb3-6]
MLGAAASLQTAAGDIRGELPGPLNLGCFDTISPWPMPLVLEHFARCHPRVGTILHEASSDGLQALLQGGQPDAAFMLPPPRQRPAGEHHDLGDEAPARVAGRPPASAPTSSGGPATSKPSGPSSGGAWRIRSSWAGRWVTAPTAATRWSTRRSPTTSRPTRSSSFTRPAPWATPRCGRCGISAATSWPGTVHP